MIIGIGGISRSGKTTLSKQIKKLAGNACIIIHMDDYIKDSCNWDIMIKKPIFYLSVVHKKFDLAHPETIVDFDFMLRDIMAAMQIFPLVIVEGSYINHDVRIKALLEKFIFLDVSKEEFIRRRLNDYRKENYWYANHLWTRFQQYGKNFNEQDSLILDAEKQLDFVSVKNYLQLPEFTKAIAS